MVKMGFFEISDHVVSKELKNNIENIIQYLPQEGLIHSFAYGSGVFQQQDRELGTMIDLILVVEDVVSWHSTNLELNYDHYSNVRLVGSQLLGYMNENVGCGVYYNTYVEICGAVVKYGVISKEAFEEDLLEWKFMYVAGRLHKPVLHVHSPYTLTPAGSAWIESVIKRNQTSALRLALLLLPKTFTKKQLYLTIAGFSYTGDSRMLLGGEKESKISALVIPILDVFHDIYWELCSQLGQSLKYTQGEFIQSQDTRARLQHLQELPGNLQRKLVEFLNKEQSIYFDCPHLMGSSEIYPDDVKRALVQLSKRPDLPSIMTTALSKIVFGASVRQTVVGFLSTGFRNSLYYAYEKFSKTKKAKAIDITANGKTE